MVDNTNTQGGIVEGSSAVSLSLPGLDPSSFLTKDQRFVEGSIDLYDKVDPNGNENTANRKLIYYPWAALPLFGFLESVKVRMRRH